MFLKKSLILLVFIFLTVLIFPPNCFSQEYEIFEISSPFQSQDYSSPTSINENNEVVGYFRNDNRTYGYKWLNGEMTLLESFGPNHSVAAINNVGQIVGSGHDDLYRGHFLSWDQQGVVHDLGLAGENFVGGLSDINDQGKMVGATYNEYSQMEDGFILHDGIKTYLGTEGSHPWAINNKDQVVGKIKTGANPQEAFLWEDGEVTLLGALGGPFSEAVDINDKGQIVGASNAYHAFIWEDGEISDLSVLNPDAFSIARAINNNGQIVGASSGDGAKAVMWEDGEIIDLNSLLENNSGWQLLGASDINDSGIIVGRGLYVGRDTGFILMPTNLVPEPSTILMFLSGIFGMFWFRKKK